MAFNPVQPTVDLYDAYGISYLHASGAASQWYNTTTIATKYPKACGWYVWRGYTLTEVLTFDEMAIAITDAFWRTSNIMGAIDIVSGAWPDNIYAQGCTSRATVIVPHGRYFMRSTGYISPFGKITGSGTASAFVASGYQTTGTALAIDPDVWVGAPAAPSGNYPETYSARRDNLRTINWASTNVNESYSEGCTVENIKFEGNMKSRTGATGFNDPSYESYGLAIFDMGETSLIKQCRFDYYNTADIELARGTPATLIDVSTFCGGLAGIMLTGCASMNIIRIYGGSADENPTWIMSRAGYSRQAGGIVVATGTKLEASGYNGSVSGESYKGIPPKGQIIFDGQGWINLKLDTVSFQTLGCRVDSLIRITNPLNVSSVTLDNCVTDWGAAANFLQVGTTRYSFQTNPSNVANAALPLMSLRPLSFKYDTSGGFTYSSQPVQTVTSTCSSRLGFLVKNDTNGTVTGAFDYTTCTPAWNPQTGFAGSPPPPPAAVLTTITVALSPNPITTAQTSQASPTCFDQNGQQIANPGGTWSIVSGPATISTSGVVTPTGTAGTAVVRYTVASPSVNGSANLVINAVVPPPPPVPVPTTIQPFTITPSSVPAGSSAQANTPVVLDQFGNPISVVGTWGVQSGTGSINISGFITTSVQSTVVISYTVAGIVAPQTASLQVTAVAPPPPPPTPLFSLTFLGKNVLALPGCIPVPSGQPWKAGQISGATFSTLSTAGGGVASNTVQVLSAPIGNVKRIVLKGAVVKENQAFRYLNDMVRTTGSQGWYKTGTSQSTPIGTYVTNGGAVDLVIIFQNPVTVTTLFGGGASTYNTVSVTMTGIEMWSF